MTDLQDSLACSAGYDLRIIFKFVEFVEYENLDFGLIVY
jgi:hypothetical protein